MNKELYIARKIVPTVKDNQNISRPVIRFSITAIALGVMIMILSIAIVHGFKRNIKEKVFGFGSHILISNFDSNTSYETVPINKQQYFTESLEKIDNVMHIQVFAIKAGIVKTEEHVQGVILKGVDGNYNWDFFSKHLISGKLPDYSGKEKSNDIIISNKLAGQLNLSLGNELVTSFIPQNNNENIRYRKFTISGIYETNLEEFDSRFILCDLHHIQKLNNWNDSLVSGFEVLINDYDKLNETAGLVWDEVGYGFLSDGSKLKVETIEEKHPQIFDWLSLLDMNVIVILTLIIVVAGLNMVSGLLVIILEKTNMIGIMKAIGAENLSIQKIFMYVGGMLVGRGLLWGNVLGISLCVLQYFTQIVPLNEQTYFISFVPVYIDVVDIILINIGCLVASMGMLIFPSMIISSIEPAKALRFD